MARRQSKGAKQMTAVESEVKSVRLELSPDVHRDFRIEAAKEGQSMAGRSRSWLKSGLEAKAGSQVAGGNIARTDDAEPGRADRRSLRGREGSLGRVGTSTTI